MNFVRQTNTRFGKMLLMQIQIQQNQTQLYRDTEFTIHNSDNIQ